jgi:precorrin-4 methylase
MSLNTTIAQIDATTLQFAPQVFAGVTAVEAAAAGLPGQTKAEIVINSVIAGAHAAEGVPIPSVAGIAALVELFVTMLSATGIFKHKAKPAPNAAQVVTVHPIAA